MDVKKLYEEQMLAFFDLHGAIRDLVYLVFRPSKIATIDDLHDARILVNKLKDAKSQLDGMLIAKNLRVGGQKDTTT